MQPELKDQELLPSTTLAMPVLNGESYGRVAQIVQIIHSEFATTPDPSSSFYPKATLLIYSDLQVKDREEILALCKQQFQGTQASIILPVAKFVRTDKGLILMEFGDTGELNQKRVAIAAAVQEYRKEKSSEFPFGFKYLSTPIHLTVGMGVSEERFNEILPELAKLQGLQIKFQVPRWTLKRTEWGTEGKIEEL